MTTMCALFGGIPLMLGNGGGCAQMGSWKL
jgi:hypothetical protein